jgi:hypothetical protein
LERGSAQQWTASWARLCANTVQMVTRSRDRTLFPSSTSPGYIRRAMTAVCYSCRSLSCFHVEGRLRNDEINKLWLAREMCSHGEAQMLDHESHRFALGPMPFVVLRLRRSMKMPKFLEKYLGMIEMQA